MKNPLNPLNQDKIIIDGLGLEILSVKPLNPLNRDSLRIHVIRVCDLVYFVEPVQIRILNKQTGLQPDSKWI